MGICGIFFGIFYCIDFEIIAFERRRQCFFRPCPAGSAAFDSRFCHFIEVHEVELLEIHNVWHVRYLWKKILELEDQRSIVKTFFVTAGVQNIGIAIAILAFLLASSNFHKMKIPTVNLKSSILV
jgi:hypothetical protein